MKKKKLVVKLRNTIAANVRMMMNRELRFTIKLPSLADPTLIRLGSFLFTFFCF